MLAPSPSQQSEQLPYGLVSLWDMYEFDVASWLKNVENLLKRSATLESNANLFPSPLPEADAASLGTFFEDAERSCRAIGLVTAAEMALEIRESINKHYTQKQHSADVVTLRRTIVANMRSLHFMRLSSEYVKYADSKSLWGDAYTSFPSAVRDMEDSGKCVAFGTGTAGVFHLMRVMEAGLKVVAKEIGIPYAPSWESYLKQLDTRFSEDYRKKEPSWKKVEPYFKEVAGDLQIVKFVWRNPTMHIVRSYTQEEAREIFSAVSAFMKRLALRLSEPKFSVAERWTSQP